MPLSLVRSTRSPKTCVFTARVLRELWPVDGSGERIQRSDLARTIGVSAPALNLFLSGHQKPLTKNLWLWQQQRFELDTIRTWITSSLSARPRLYRIK